MAGYDEIFEKGAASLTILSLFLSFYCTRTVTYFSGNFNAFFLKRTGSKKK
jgi:hypothetical protein